MKKIPDLLYPVGRGTPKFYLMCKLSLFMLVFCVLQTHAANSQMDAKLQINIRELPVKEVFKSIKNQSDFSFIYSDEDIEQLGNITINENDITVKEVVEKCLKNSTLTYEVHHSVIIIKNSNISNLFQEEGIISGVVTDSKGNPIPFVNIIDESSKRGVITDSNGKFTMRVNNPTGKINASFIGFKTVMVDYVVGTPVNITLTEEIEGLDEVTVVAYGTQSTREVTGSISSIKAEEIKDVPSANISNLLQGKVAGMKVTNSTGTPGGGGTSIVIRGFNSLSVESDRRASEPLWVIDGVPVHSFTSPVTGTNALSDIDPNDIESIEVLKDAASASLYGSRAANGVILVTTKKGKSGKAKLSLNYSHSYGFQPTMSDITGGVAERRLRNNQYKGLLTSYREKTADGYYVYTNPTNFTDAYNNGGQYDLWWNKGLGYDNVALQDSLNPFYNNSTNWFDLFLQSSKTDNLNLNINGGTEKVKYNIGLGYYDEKGIVSGTDFNRVNVLSNFQIKPFDKMDVDFRVYLARTDRGRATQSGFADLELMRLDPYALSTTLPGINSAVFENAKNNIKGVQDDNIGYRLRTSFNLSYELLKGLTLRSSAALDYFQGERYYFAPSTLNHLDESKVSNTIEKESMVLNENLLNYKLGFKNHKFDLMLGSSFQWNTEINLSGGAVGGASDQIHWAVNFPEIAIDANGAPRPTQAFYSDKMEKTLIGFFGRFNYKFKNRYLASLTMRRDGSSTFGEDNRWGTFPSGSVGWIASEENFVKNISAIDFLKFRTSYGKTGLHFSEPYLALGVFKPSAYSFLGKSAIEPDWNNGLYNPELGWEETSQWDVGFDLQLLKNKFEVTFDYYNRYTDRLLAEVPLPSLGSYTGYKLQWQNAYSISNEGVELMLKANIINKKDFFWDISLNIARNWNRFEGGADGRDFKSGSGNISIKGKPLNQLYVYKQDGFYQTDEEVPVYDYIKQKYYYSQYSDSKYARYSAGDPKYLDLNGDGKINSEDKIAAGSPLPIAIGGIVNTITWKNFDFNCLFNFSISKKILNAAVGEGLSVDLNLLNGNAHALHPVLMDISNYTFWEQEGDNPDLARIQVDPGKKVYSNFTNNMIEDVSFIKLKSVVLGYTLKDFIPNSKMAARFYVSGENLFTITNYSGRDPEAVDAVYGIDRAQTYPLIKKVTLGVSVTF